MKNRIQSTKLGCTLGIVLLLAACENKVDADIEKYKILELADASASELCSLSTEIAATFLEARRSEEYQVWRKTRETDCVESRETFSFDDAVGKPAMGKVSGRLSYPSDVIPDDLKVCWRNLQTEESECARPNAKDRYEISIPTGLYHVWARTDDAPNFRGYFSDASKCGLSVDCVSHKPVTVRVESGETTQNVDPSDWYG